MIWARDSSVASLLQNDRAGCYPERSEGSLMIWARDSSVASLLQNDKELLVGNQGILQSLRSFRMTILISTFRMTGLINSFRMTGL